VEFLDAVGLPHEEGILNLPEDAEAPAAATVKKAATALAKAHGREGLVYLSTLLVADEEFWAGVAPVLEGFTPEGEKAPTAKKKES